MKNQLKTSGIITQDGQNFTPNFQDYKQNPPNGIFPISLRHDCPPAPPAPIDLCVSNGTIHNLSLVFLKKDRNSDCWERI